MRNLILCVVAIVATLTMGFEAKAEINDTKPKTISLLTCEPGNMLYTLFGHTAIRIKDVDSDWVFNYGTFDFDTPNFYGKYIKGELMYQLAAQPFSSFYNTYDRMEVAVYEQELKLDSAQQQKLIRALLENYKPENRTYLYDFLYDNCATRVRDLFEKHITDSESTYRWAIAKSSDKTFWNLLDEKLRIAPWCEWGIHTLLGQDGNKVATAREEMFLPEMLMQAVSQATIDGTPLAKEAVKIIDYPKRTEIKTPWYVNPQFAFWALALVIIGGTFKMKRTRFIFIPMLFLTGVLGLLLFYLAAFSLHPMTNPNWNLLWACPLNLFFIPFLVKNRWRTINIYLNCYMGLLIAGIAILFWTTPAISFATIPLMLIMFYLSYKELRCLP
ncbi:MAG: DUF4105 domain-containing protein [Marinifilaceae bacterium]|nr:DUF4105 domain-containing protein [Marinifilaceae bacterium]